MDAATAVSVIKSNDRVFVHTAAAQPRHLTQALVARVRDGGAALTNIECCHLHLEGGCAHADPPLAGAMHSINFFVGANQVGSGTAPRVHARPGSSRRWRGAPVFPWGGPWEHGSARRSQKGGPTLCPSSCLRLRCSSVAG